MYKVLIVDDVQTNLFTLKALLEESFSLDIYEAFNAEEAFEILNKTLIDLIITDVQMPEIDGFAMANMLKKRKNTKDIPIIFMTAVFNQEAYLKKGYALGAIDYVIKPIDSDLFISKLQNYLNLFDLKRRFDTILNTQSSLLIIIKNQKITYANKAFFETFGVKNIQEFEAKYNSFEKQFFLNDPSLELQESLLGFLIYNPKAKDKTLYNIGSENQKRIYSFQANPLNEEEHIISLTDITQIQKQNQLLQTQSKQAAMGEMISMIAHQWRQPLATMSIIVSRLLMKLELKKIDESYIRDALLNLDDILQYMGKTIDDFRNFFTNDNLPKLLEIQELIETPKKLIAAMFSRYQVEFSIDYEIPQTTKLFINNSLIEQVLINIYKNAIDEFEELSMKKNTIDVKVSSDEEFLYIAICDSAGGIQQEHLDKVFEPYFSTKGKNGTGLGLYISKTIIEDTFKGKLEVYNQRDGTCFKISLSTSYIQEKEYEHV